MIWLVSGDVIPTLASVLDVVTPGVADDFLIRSAYFFISFHSRLRSLHRCRIPRLRLLACHFPSGQVI